MLPANQVDPAAVARAAFERVSADAPGGVAFAPGRVNLIGEHTDYNDGFVLPMAIGEGIAAAFGPNGDCVLRVHASDIGDTREVPLAALQQRGAPITGWFRYAAGMAWAMLGAGVPLTGTSIALASNLPSGAGLSSSAALQLVVARALAAVAGIDWNRREAALMAQRAEHEFAGVASGVMDQMTVACAVAGRALLLDCRSLVIQDVTIPDDLQVVVINTGVRRSLATSAYNERRAACERAVAAIRQLSPAVRALRDVDAPLLLRAGGMMDEVAFRRASHVVAENLRPAQFASALERGDPAAAGGLMVESHRSLRDLYEVSCAELDTLVSLSDAHPGCHGARLTGAGFGGCAIALVDSGQVDCFTSEIPAAYREQTGRQPQVLVGRPSAGARILN